MRIKFRTIKSPVFSSILTLFQGCKLNSNCCFDYKCHTLLTSGRRYLFTNMVCYKPDCIATQVVVSSCYLSQQPPEQRQLDSKQTLQIMTRDLVIASSQGCTRCKPSALNFKLSSCRLPNFSQNVYKVMGELKVPLRP